MKKRLQGIIAGLLAGVMLTGGLAYAKDISEKAQIYFRNIKIFIDGGEIVPKGSDGSVVEPFIMNGATYLPVRAIAEALGKDVAWDGKTSTVYIGKKDQLQPDNYLDRIQYNQYEVGKHSCKLTVMYGDMVITDCNNKSYTSGVIYDFTGCTNGKYDRIGDIEDGAHMRVGYPLNSQYSKLTGKIVLPYENNAINIIIYGDDTILYKAQGVNYSMPFSFDVDVEGINELVIEVSSVHRYDGSYVALTDLALYE